MSKKLITTVCMTVALASSAGVAGADTGQPQQGGGCNMVFGPLFHSPNSDWLHMMTGSANGAGAANMADMQRLFSDLRFCLG